MRLIKPMVIVEDDLDMIMPNGLTLAQHMLKKVEAFTRKCYKSEGKMTEDSYKKFLPAVFGTRRHTGIAEHRLISVTFITDRGVSHEHVRHRMASYLQESTRYCDYAGDKAPTGVTYILPPWVTPGAKMIDGEYTEWAYFLEELKYNDVSYDFWRTGKYAWRPEQARYWLPQGVKTEYAASLNLGSWWNFLNKRAAKDAHPQIRQLAIPLLEYFQQKMPEIFNSIPHEVCGTQNVFSHKDQMYEKAKLVVNPFYDQVPFEEVHIG